MPNNLVKSTKTKVVLCHTCITAFLGGPGGGRVNIDLYLGGLSGGDRGVHISTREAIGDVKFLVVWRSISKDDTDPDWWRLTEGTTALYLASGGWPISAAMQQHADSVTVPRLRAVYEEVMTAEIARDARIAAFCAALAAQVSDDERLTRESLGATRQARAGSAQLANLED